MSHARVVCHVCVCVCVSCVLHVFPCRADSLCCGSPFSCRHAQRSLSAGCPAQRTGGRLAAVVLGRSSLLRKSAPAPRDVQSFGSLRVEAVPAGWPGVLCSRGVASGRAGVPGAACLVTHALVTLALALISRSGWPNAVDEEAEPTERSGPGKQKGRRCARTEK